MRLLPLSVVLPALYYVSKLLVYLFLSSLPPLFGFGLDVVYLILSFSCGYYAVSSVSVWRLVQRMILYLSHTYVRWSHFLFYFCLWYFTYDLLWLLCEIILIIFCLFSPEVIFALASMLSLRLASVDSARIQVCESSARHVWTESLEPTLSSLCPSYWFTIVLLYLVYYSTRSPTNWNMCWTRVVGLLPQSAVLPILHCFLVPFCDLWTGVGWLTRAFCTSSIPPSRRREVFLKGRGKR